MTDKGNHRDIPGALTITAKLLASGLALAVIANWIVHAMPALSKERAEKKKLAPLVNEARTLGINYESVLAFPYQTLGKPAVWCIKNKGEDGAFYNGDGDKRLLVDPLDNMPLFTGSKHAACTDMLVIISSVTKRTFSTQEMTFVSVKYIRQI